MVFFSICFSSVVLFGLNLFHEMRNSHLKLLLILLWTKFPHYNVFMQHNSCYEEYVHLSSGQEHLSSSSFMVGVTPTACEIRHWENKTKGQKCTKKLCWSLSPNWQDDENFRDIDYKDRRSHLSTWKYQFSYDHWGQATLRSVCTWMGDGSSVCCLSVAANP